MAMGIKVGIIGAGFVGLSAALCLAERGDKVVVFEKESSPGGLAGGFKRKNWKWTLEQHYHHWFTNDTHVINLAKKLKHRVITKRPKTSTFFDCVIYQTDSPMSLLRFSPIPFLDRIRTGVGIALLRFNPFLKPFEKISASGFIKKVMGTSSWKVLWEPLFKGKFGEYSDLICASWFWSRISKRTSSLVYPTGGFLNFAQKIESKLRILNAKFHYNTVVESLRNIKGRILVVTGVGKRYYFDKVICTLPTTVFIKMTHGIPESYKNSYSGLPGLGAINLILSLKQKFFEDNTYWLNINDRSYPFLALVEHTNYMDNKFYNGEHLLYIGNYLSHDHDYFSKNKEELLKIFIPYLKKINPEFKRSMINDYWLFKTAFAQPVVATNYSEKIPPIKTPINGVFLANIQQVYPHDRGTNYAVELGEKVADLVKNL